MKPLDLNRTVDSTQNWSNAYLRAFLPDRQEGDPPVGELVVEPMPRRLVARGKNGVVDRLDGVVTVTMPVGWELPIAPLRFRFLVALEGRRNRVLYCACWGVVRKLYPGESDRAVIGFESYSPLFLIPTNVDAEEVLRYETLLTGVPVDIVTLITYQGWLWENAKSWGRRRWIEGSLKRLAANKVS